VGVGPRGTLPLHEPTPVLVVLLDLSLTPPCPRIITGCEPWQAAAMAIGLDLLIVGLECWSQRGPGPTGLSRGLPTRP